jgi:3-deoxy-manno-octulosonate cytidylyltransferase (CMP-KDO synthetase)
MPLVLRVWEHVRDLQVVDAIVVATDSVDVLHACTEAGASAVMTRTEHPSGTDRVAEVAERPEYAQHEVIVNVQGDEPELERDALVGAIEMVAGHGFEIGTAAVLDSPAILDDPNVVMVVIDDSYGALMFSRAPLPFLRDPADAPARSGLVRRHLGIYAYRRDALKRLVALGPHPLEVVERLEQLRALAAGIRVGVATVDAAATGGIDTEADLARANARWTDHIHR